jgi:hypothetical protein
MPKLWDSLFQMSAGMAETSVTIVDWIMRGMQEAIQSAAGSGPRALPATAPLDGRKSLDEATSDFSNRLFRFWWTMRHSPQEMLTSWEEVAHALRNSFGGLTLEDPREWVTLPLQLPLSFGTLATQQTLRGIHTAQIMGPGRAMEFASYMMETLTDVHVFVSLQYKDLLKRYEEMVRKNPNDADAVLGRAKTLLKMGLYPEAVEDFRAAAKKPALRPDALRDSAVANYRAGRYRESITDAVASLDADPSSRRARYWMWLAARKLGGYPDEVPESWQVEVKAGRNTPGVQFEDVGAEIGLDKTSGGRGTAVFDMDGDGYLDIVVSSAHAGCSVYRNNGDGTYSDVSVGSGLDACVNTFAVVVGDYNNDGLDDLYITQQGFYPGESRLYRNNGDGTFTDVTRESGAGCWGPSFAAQWVDYDCDGNLDLFVCSNLGGVFDRSLPNRLFHNNGDGTFTDVSRQSGLATSTPTIGGCWGDYDNDGYPDLFVSSGLGHSKLFRNNRDGTFTDVSREAGLDHVVIGTVAFWCDYDNDGWLDLVQCTWSPEDDVLDTLFHGRGPDAGRPMRVFHNNGDGTFTLKTFELGLTGCFGTMSANLGDFNNDGYVDFLLGNGDPHMNRTEPPTALEFDAVSGKYRNITFAAGLPFVGKGHGANLADLAGDGRLSLIMASGGAYPGDLMTMSVFRPTSLPGNYLNVRLVGVNSNRNAIGARLRLDAGGRSRHSLVSGGSGFGCLPYEQHFGLGTCVAVDALEIWWPGGARQHLEHLPVNTTIRIIEGRKGWEEVYKKPAAKAAGAARRTA